MEDDGRVIAEDAYLDGFIREVPPKCGGGRVSEVNYHFVARGYWIGKEFEGAELDRLTKLAVERWKAL